MLSSCCAARIDVVSGPCSNERDIEIDRREKGAESTMPLLFFFQWYHILGSVCGVVRGNPWSWGNDVACAYRGCVTL